VPTEIQRGELSDRLRRFLGLTGRIPLQMDETVVPIANVQDLASPPYRLLERGFSGSDEIAAAVGFPSMIALTLPKQLAVGLPERGALVVSQLTLWNPNAGAAAMTYRVSFNLTAAWTLRQQVFDLDRVVNANGTDVRLPAVLRSNNGIAVVGFELDRFTLLASEGLIVDLNPPIVLGPGVELIIAGQNNAITRGAFRGVYFPDILL
jgi:hypothetical protein